MSATFDLYVPGQTWVHRLDARVKLAFALGTGLLILIWSSLPLFLVTLVLIHLLLRMIGFHWSRIRAIWLAIAPFMLLIFLLWPLFDRAGDTVLLEFGFVRITGEGILAGTGTALRVATISFVFLVWLGTTDQRAMVWSFVRLGLPFSLGMALTIGLRFVTTFVSVFRTVSDAQQSRGLILTGRGIGRLRRMIPILVAALVTSLRMSEQLAWTLEARAFGYTKQRTVLRDLRMTTADWITLALFAIIFFTLLYLTITTGLGRDVTWSNL
jgi:energy-coupling factor transporter transmembrane protein EcfT